MMLNDFWGAPNPPAYFKDGQPSNFAAHGK